MRITLDTIQGCPITLDRDEAGLEEVDFVADADVDADGSGGNPDNDPYFQPDTSLHFQGHALNAYKVPFVVVPPIVVHKTRGVVLGCRALVTNIRTGRKIEAVVADLGPARKVGEVSVECAKRLGIPSNPNTGGAAMGTIRYQIFPNIPAVLDGVEYDLQPRA